ncbi:MAG: C40 family peptidase [Thiothrix sp.]
MLQNKQLVVSYSLLGSTLLMLAGCSITPKQLSPLQQSLAPEPPQTPPKAEKASTQRAHKTLLNPAEKTLQTPEAMPATPLRSQQTPQPDLPKAARLAADNITLCALRQCGKGYCWGGNSPLKGFDCSGLTQYSFRQGANLALPRTAAEQYRVANKIPQEHAQRGDLIFFRTRGKQVSHVGIYLGGNRFIHAPRSGKAITITPLAGYWKRHLVGFGRIPGVQQPLLPKSVIAKT